MSDVTRASSLLREQRAIEEADDALFVLGGPFANLPGHRSEPEVL